MIHFFLTSLLLSLGNHQEGEIEIVQDPSLIQQVEETTKQRFIKKGISEEKAQAWSRTGIVSEDIYWIWKRDPVIFPSGALGTYNSLSWKTEAGVVVLPILPDGRIALNLNFRHATRSWEWELPRGCSLKGEGSYEAAIREVQEETGLQVKKLVSLGSIAPDTGVLSTVVDVYAGWVGEEREATPEYSEAIDGIHLFTLREIDEGLKRGYIESETRGKVPIRDSFLTFALYQAKELF